MNSHEKPTISVIIPTYKDTNLLKRCISALEKQNIPKNIFEVIVVNNDKENNITVSSTIIDIKIIQEPKPGSYSARNTGIKNSSGNLIAFTDSDCIPKPDWLSAAIANMGKAGTERIAGRVETFLTGPRHSIPEQYELITSFNQERNARNGVSVTANLISHRFVFNEVGFFNQDLLSGGDFEWNKRAQSNGFKIQYSHDVAVAHPVRATNKEIQKKSKRIIGGNYTNAKNKIKFTASLLVPPVSNIYLISKASNLSLFRRLTLILYCIAIKKYCFFTSLKLLLRIEKPSRQ